jgi:hypothetical protein
MARMRDLERRSPEATIPDSMETWISGPRHDAQAGLDKLNQSRPNRVTDPAAASAQGH